jgi:integrase
MRRSVASHYEAAGGNATELLGHSSRSVTLAYLDPRIVPQQHAVDLLFRPGDRPGNEGAAEL